MDFPNNLKKFRLQANSSQKEIALSLGVSQPEYGRMEMGRRQIGRHITKLAEIFSTTPEEILAAEMDAQSLNDYSAHYNQPPQLLKIFGTPTLDGRIINSDQVSDYVTIAANITANSSYGVLVPSDYISSKLSAGDLLIIDPTKPVSAGDLAVIGKIGENQLIIACIVRSDVDNIVYIKRSEDSGEAIRHEEVRVFDKVAGCFFS